MTKSVLLTISSVKKCLIDSIKRQKVSYRTRIPGGGCGGGLISELRLQRDGDEVEYDHDAEAEVHLRLHGAELLQHLGLEKGYERDVSPNV